MEYITFCDEVVDLTSEELQPSPFTMIDKGVPRYHDKQGNVIWRPGLSVEECVLEDEGDESVSSLNYPSHEEMNDMMVGQVYICFITS